MSPKVAVKAKARRPAGVKKSTLLPGDDTGPGDASLTAETLNPASALEETPQTPTILKLPDLSERSERAGPKGAPTVGEWAGFLRYPLVYASILYAYWLLSDVEEATRDDQSALEMSDDQARAIVHPFARLIARTDWAKRYGRGVVDSEDIWGALAALLGYAYGTRKAYQAKMRRIAARRLEDARSEPQRQIGTADGGTPAGGAGGGELPVEFTPPRPPWAGQYAT